MISKKDFNKELYLVIENALREDVGKGDYTSEACIAKDTKGQAQLVVKDEGFISGIEFAEKILNHVDSTLIFSKHLNDGDAVKYGDIVLTVEGDSKSILKTERILLNVMQRMSAITTKTKRLVSMLKGFPTKILDTRKTTPGIRVIEKWAVSLGGGVNHRFALYDMIMIKDNHIQYCGGISKAISATKNYLTYNKLDLPIIIEAKNINDVQDIITHDGLHRILLDNFQLKDLSHAIKVINKKYPTEASGNIDERNIKSYAEKGVDYISCGALTHSVHNMDLSLRAL